MGRYILRLLLDHRLYRPTMCHHGLCPDPAGLVFGVEKEETKGPLRRAGVDRPVQPHLLEHRHVHHVQFRLLAQPAGVMAKLAQPRDGRVGQVVLSGAVRLLAATDRGGEH